MDLKLLILGLAAVPALVVLGLGGLIAFGTSPPPPPMPAVDAVAMAATRSQPLAALQTYVARDGAPLAYRSYLPPDAPAIVAVLIHGSGGSSANMNVLGLALAAQGIAAYAPDERGHGDSGVRGDIGHAGQMEDDLVDLVGLIRRAHPHARLVLVGHSSGGGFALRVAGAPQGRLFDRFVLLAPYLGYAAPTSRPASGGWVSAYTGRIVGLAIANRLGFHGLDGLPTLAFASEPGVPPRTWSYRLMQNFGPSPDYRADAAKAAGRIRLVAGALDESMFADRYAEAFSGLAPPVGVEVLPDIHHMDLISDPRALPWLTDAIRAP